MCDDKVSSDEILPTENKEYPLTPTTKQQAINLTNKSPTLPTDNKPCATNVHFLHHSGKPSEPDGEHRYDRPPDLSQGDNKQHTTGNGKTYCTINWEETKTPTLHGLNNDLPTTVIGNSGYPPANEDHDSKSISSRNTAVTSEDNSSFVENMIPDGEKHHNSSLSINNDPPTPVVGNHRSPPTCEDQKLHGIDSISTSIPYEEDGTPCTLDGEKHSPPTYVVDYNLSLIHI